MTLDLTPDSARARDLAKRCVAPGEELDLELFVRALYHGTDIRDRVPGLEAALEEPEARRPDVPDAVPLAADLSAPLTALARRSDGPLTPERLLLELLWSPAGLAIVSDRGLPEDVLNAALEQLGDGPRPDRSVAASDPAPRIGWRATEARREALESLNPLGRMLTEGPIPTEAFIGMEETLEALIRTLVKRKQKSALVTGEPGTGKTALVRELARRLMTGHPSIPARLRDYDIFEVSPTFLKAGTSLVGQYEERLKTLMDVVSEHPKIVLFVDEVHSLLQSGIHERSNFSDANEAFKQALAQGDFSLIGATTTAEYRYYMEPDQALVQRFSLIRIQPPGPAETRAIVRGRLPEIEGFYGVDVPDSIVDETVRLTDEYLTRRAQPRKSIQLLDEACAYCVTRTPPLETVTEAALWEVLEDTVGHGIARQTRLTQDEVFRRLANRIVGQDPVLRGIARAFLAGLGGWVSDRDAPRGVFFFGGPTGVGKTETALLLAELLGGGHEAVVRIDCNTLQSSGGDSGQAINVLLGPPPGYIGYVRGKGGALSRIRERPESIVLFDEIEKADPGVGEVLLQIMDSGRCEDSDGNLLDFRRAFLVFTTNAGTIRDGTAAIGFRAAGEPVGPSVDVGRMKDEIRRTGLGDEFLGRITHTFMFRSLDRDSVSRILASQLAKLEDIAEVRGCGLAWQPGVLDHLVSEWQPRFGVRHLLAILRNRIVEQLSVADAQGELAGVTRISLEVLDAQADAAAGDATGLAIRRRQGSTLVIELR